MTGFYGGERAANEYVLRAGDAHAWVEADVPGGVLRLDATPAENRSAASATLLGWLLRAYEALEVRWVHGVVDYSFADQVTFFRGVGSNPVQRQLPAAGLPWAWAGTAATLGLLGVLLFLLLRRGPDEAQKLGGELHRLAARVGLLAKDRWLEELPSTSPAVPQQLRRAVSRYLEARFGTRPLAPGERRALLSAVRDALRGPRRV